LSNYYYEAIQVKVADTGSYRLSSNSKINLDATIYNNNFDPFNPDTNAFSKDHGSCGDGQFKLDTTLLVNAVYILVVTTVSPNMRGHFSVFVSGSSNVSLSHIGEYLYFFG